MNRRFRVGFFGGVLGALVLVAIQFALQGLGVIGTPVFVSEYRHFFGAQPPLDLFSATVLYITAGGLWGALFGGLVESPNVPTGILFGFLPAFWDWLIVSPFSGGEYFNGFTAQGLLYPILYYVGIWGSFLGWYCARKLRPGET